MRKRSLILGFLIPLFLQTIYVDSVGAQTPTDPTLTIPASPTTGQASTPVPTNVVELATPGAGGKIIHTVVAGETLISIAEAYGVPFTDLLELNGFTVDALIYPGDEVIIQEGFTPTSTHSPTLTATHTKVPTSTRRPTRTPLSQEQTGRVTNPAVQTQLTLTPTIDIAESGSDSIGTILLVAIAVLGGGGILMIALGSFLRRNT